MLIIKFFLLFSFPLFCAPIGLFIPPEGWEYVKSKEMPEAIQIGFLKNQKGFFRTSLNLSKEKVSIPLKEYLAIVRRLHETELKVDWRDLGDFFCRAGKGRLIEIRSSSSCGEIKMLQLIFVQDGWAYILTGAARKQDFAADRKELLRSLRSFSIIPDLFSAIEDDQKRLALQQTFNSFTHSSTEEKQSLWNQVSKTLMEYKDLGSYWLFLALQEGHERIFGENPQ